MSTLLEKIAVTRSTRCGAIYSIPHAHFRAGFHARPALYDARLPWRLTQDRSVLFPITSAYFDILFK
jgi:hypothetical protein